MEPLHGVQDEAKLAALIECLERDGWQGMPLVADGEQLLTGSHRYAATRVLGWTDNEIPTIDIRDLFVEAGLDFDALHAEYGAPAIDDYDYADMINRELPGTMLAAYGIELG